jgi:hypothetical protein
VRPPVICLLAAALLACQTLTNKAAAQTGARSLLTPSGTDSRLVNPGFELQSRSQLPSPRPRWSETQRTGMRWGASAGALVGMLVGWSLVPDDCSEPGCDSAVAGAKAIYLAAGAMAGVVVGGAVGLVVGTAVDDGGAEHAFVALQVRVE